MARKPGSFVHFACCVCGVVERVRGGNSRYCCAACKPLRRPEYYGWVGKEEAMAAVSAAIKAGQLPHPRGLRCADCSGPAVEYEHRDYNKPLQVDPICRGCNLRRGPAIPAHGAVQAAVNRNRAPYSLRRSAERILSAIGRDPAQIGHLPKRLTIEHWREIAPLFARLSLEETEAA